MFTPHIPLQHATKAGLLKLAESLYKEALTSIASGEDVTPEKIRIVNDARKEIDACKAAGFGN